MHCGPSRKRAGRSTVRVVLDANVLVSAAFGGTPREAYSKALNHKLLISDSIRAEWFDVVQRVSRRLPSSVSIELRKLFLTALSGAELAEVVHRVRLCRDPKDDEYLSLARSAAADAIVTGDADLLALKPATLSTVGLGSLRILTPRDFLDRS